MIQRRPLWGLFLVMDAILAHDRFRLKRRVLDTRILVNPWEEREPRLGAGFGGIGFEPGPRSAALQRQVVSRGVV